MSGVPRSAGTAIHLEQPVEKRQKLIPELTENNAKKVKRSGQCQPPERSIEEALSDKCGSSSHDAERVDVDHDPEPEGVSKKRMRGLVEIAQLLSYVPKHYAAHVLRGVWQDEEVKKHKQALADERNVGRMAMFTIDMKSKTSTDKNRKEQGYNMGAKGMSLQGGMLQFYTKETSEIQTHYVDVIYDQTSNQHLEEAMSALSAQLGFIRTKWPFLEEIVLVSDKCSNFNSYGQVRTMNSV